MSTDRSKAVHLLRFFILYASLVSYEPYCSSSHLLITKTCLFKFIENFTTKNENFQIKISDIFHISAQNIDCGYSLEPPRRGSSNKYPQSMLLSRNKKNNVYPCKPQFYYIKVGFEGSKVYRYVFVMFWCLTKAMLFDCGASCVSSLILFVSSFMSFNPYLVPWENCVP